MKEILLEDLLKNGVHFGHQKKKWHPNMKPYIYGMRNGVYVINLEETAKKLQAAMAYAKGVVSNGGVVLFVGTKEQAKAIVKKYAVEIGMPYIIERWPGGMFTNFESIARLFKKLNKLKDEKESGQLQKYTKKERLLFDREIERLEKLIGGVAHLKKIPEAIFVIDIKNEKTAIREAQKKNVPIIAIVDTNANPDDVQCPIPANDDAMKSIDYITSCIADAIQEGAKARPSVTSN